MKTTIVNCSWCGKAIGREAEGLLHYHQQEQRRAKELCLNMPSAEKYTEGHKYLCAECADRAEDATNDIEEKANL